MRSGRDFRWLWAAFAVSTFGTWIAFDAFPLIAILVLHSGPAQVALLAATGLAAAAVLAVPLGPWVEFRRKRPVMIAMDLTRFAALLSIPVAYAAGALTFVQLLAVAVVVGAADIAFRAASGACLKTIVAREDLLEASSRLEATMWTATVAGPPLGGAAIGVFGPVVTVVVDAVSYVLSALGIRAIGARERPPARDAAARMSARDLLEGWRFILRHRALRPLFFNTVCVNSLIIGSAPVVTVLMLGQLSFKPWQYGLAFGAPCVGGLLGARVAPRAVARMGRDRVMLASGVLRACWSLGLVLIQPGLAGIVLVLVVQFGLVTCAGTFNSVFAAYRLEQSPGDRVARVLSAWNVSGNVCKAATTILLGLLAAATSPRAAVAVAGGLLLLTPLLLPRRALARAISLKPSTAEEGDIWPVVRQTRSATSL